MRQKLSRLFAAAAIAAAPIFALSAQTGDEKNAVAAIRARYNQLNRRLKRCRKVERDVRDHYRSLEGDTLEAYFCNGQASPGKIVVTHYSETSRLVEEYYYQNGEVFFALSRHLRYDRTFGKVVRIDENRYYFAADQLIRWVGGEGNKAVAVNGAEGDKQEQEVLGRAKEASALAKAE